MYGKEVKWYLLKGKKSIGSALFDKSTKPNIQCTVSVYWKCHFQSTLNFSSSTSIYILICCTTNILYVLSYTSSGNYANNTHILGRNQQSVHFRVQYSHLFLCAAAAAGAASQPIINSTVYFSCTVRLLSSIKVVDEPKDQHHCSEGIQHREPTPVLSLSTPVLCSQLLMWQEKCEHGFGKLQFSSPSSPGDSKGKLVHSSDSWSKQVPAKD